MNYQALTDLFINKMGLSESHLIKFIDTSHSKTLAKKDFLIEAGSICNVIGYIESGLIRSFVQKDDQEYNTDFYFNDYFVSAYSSVVTQLPTEYAFQALTETKIIYITLDEYKELTVANPEWLKFGKYIAEFFLTRKCKKEISFLKQSAAERLNEMLVTHPGIEQLIPQYHIASYLGIKPESLSRIKLTDLLDKRLKNGIY